MTLKEDVVKVTARFFRLSRVNVAAEANNLRSGSGMRSPTELYFDVLLLRSTLYSPMLNRVQLARKSTMLSPSSSSIVLAFAYS